jgi:hypothetical protein
VTFRKGDRVAIVRPFIPARWGLVVHDQRDAIVTVNLWSDRLGRFTYEHEVIHERFLRLQFPTSSTSSEPDPNI